MLKAVHLVLTVCLVSNMMVAQETTFSLEQVNDSNVVLVVGSWDHESVLGWTWSVCHNPAEVSIGTCADQAQPQNPCADECASVACPEDMQSPGPEEQPADFHLTTIFGNGIAQNVVLSFDDSWSLPATARFEMLTITYDFVPDLDCSQLDFCRTADDDPASLLFIAGDSFVVPEMRGLNLCPGQGCSLLMKLASTEPGAVSVLLDTCAEQEVTGFQLGLQHEAAAVQVESVMEGSAVMAATGGDGADFWGVTIIEGSGATLGAVLALEPDGDSWHALPPDTPDQEIAVVTFVCAPGTSGEVTTQVALTDDLGNPPVGVVIDVDGTSLFPAKGDPVSVTILCQGDVDFIRGDANQDGRMTVSDGIAITKAVFGAGQHLDKIRLCWDSADGNDDGVVWIDDAVYVLEYLFRNGDLIPAPVGTCGPDPTDDELDCSAFSCP